MRSVDLVQGMAIMMTQGTFEVLDLLLYGNGVWQLCLFGDYTYVQTLYWTACRQPTVCNDYHQVDNKSIRLCESKAIMVQKRGLRGWGGWGGGGGGGRRNVQGLFQFLRECFGVFGR